MKVKCIDNYEGRMGLTLNKEYEVFNVIGQDGNYPLYQVKNDLNYMQTYPSTLFETVDNEKDVKVQCQKCIHNSICGHKKEWLAYCKEHIELRKKSILFDVEPSCKYYIDEDIVNNKAKDNVIKIDICDNVGIDFVNESDFLKRFNELIKRF